MKTDHLQFFDVHAHLHDSRVIRDMDGIMERAELAGVRFTASCATMEDNFETTLLLAERFKGIIPCLGIHPWFLSTLSKKWEIVLGEALSRTLSCVGETGLDFMERSADRDLQIQVFRQHLALAKDLGRPVNIHIRKAWDSFIHMIKEMGPFPAGGLVHSFSGSADLAGVITNHGFHISFSGAVTRPNAKKAVRALAAVSLDHILFETDAPDLYPSLGASATAPIPLNEPGLVREIVGIAACRRGMAFEKLAEKGYGNALALFDPVIRRNPLR